MIILDSTSDIVRLVTSSANAVDVLAAFFDDVSGSPYTAGAQPTAISSATTSTVVSSPAASTRRHIKKLSFCCRGGANTLTPQYFDGSTSIQLHAAVALADEETLCYEDGAGWYVLDPSGQRKTSNVASIPVEETGTLFGSFSRFSFDNNAATNLTSNVTDNGGGEASVTFDLAAASDTLAGVAEIATQAEQETGTDVVRIVTPGRQVFHQSAAKCWGFTTGAGSPSLNAQSFNMTSITDTATGRLTVTIATDFSSSAWVGVAMCGCATNANRMTSSVSKAAGSVILEASSATATLADPGTGWDWVFFGDR